MNNVGLKREYLELYDYREDYPSIYEQEKEELLKIYQDRIRYIDHVGSTSIKDIKSKPIIDINIQTDDLEDFKRFTESTVEGDIYTVKKEPTLGGDYLIRKEEDGRVKAFIHVYKIGDINGITSILFRDYLNNHEDEKKRYEKLKLDLYKKYKDERKKYTHGKDKYIKEVINKALKEIFLSNLEKMHTTDLGIKRIKKNINEDIDDVVKFCKNKILDKNCNIYKTGKNWYCEVDNIIITINSYSYTIITAHIKK